MRGGRRAEKENNATLEQEDTAAYSGLFAPDTLGYAAVPLERSAPLAAAFPPPRPDDTVVAEVEPSALPLLCRKDI